MCFCVCLRMSAVKEVWVTFREQELVSAFILSRDIEQHFTNTRKRGSGDEKNGEMSVCEREETHDSVSIGLMEGDAYLIPNVEYKSSN